MGISNIILNKGIKKIKQKRKLKNPLALKISTQKGEEKKIFFFFICLPVGTEKYPWIKRKRKLCVEIFAQRK